MRVQRSVLLLALVSSIACQSDPHAHLYTTVKPAPSDVVGVYRLASETLLNSDISDLGGRSCFVRLSADGTFEAVNVPPWMDAPEPNLFDRLLSGSGTWRIDAVGTVDNGWNSKTVWGIYLDSPTVKLAAAHLTGRSSPYGLLFSIGDPDAGEALILRRER